MREQLNRQLWNRLQCEHQTHVHTVDLRLIIVLIFVDNITDRIPTEKSNVYLHLNPVRLFLWPIKSCSRRSLILKSSETWCVTGRRRAVHQSQWQVNKKLISNPAYKPNLHWFISSRSVCELWFPLTGYGGHMQTWFLSVKLTWEPFWFSKFLLSVSLVKASYISTQLSRSCCWQTAETFTKTPSRVDWMTGLLCTTHVSLPVGFPVRVI